MRDDDISALILQAAVAYSDVPLKNGRDRQGMRLIDLRARILCRLGVHLRVISFRSVRRKQ